MKSNAWLLADYFAFVIILSGGEGAGWQFEGWGAYVPRTPNANDSKCKIYETRPKICIIDEMYKIKYVKFFSKKEFYIENARVCNLLQEKHHIDDNFRVKIRGE